MRRSTFLQAALSGLGISIVAAIGFHLFSVVLPTDLTIRGLIAGAGFITVVQLIRASGERVGLISSVTLWAVMNVVLLWLEPPLAHYLAVHIIFIWLTRSVYFYSSVLASMLDLALCAASFCAVAWAAFHTGNVFLSFWCFFLVQALHGSIPLNFNSDRTNRGSIHTATHTTESRFDQAHRAAQAALGKLLSMH